MSELSRRDFLRAGLGAAASLAVGEAMQPVAAHLDETSQRVTGTAGGNAGVTEAVKDDQGQITPESVGEFVDANESLITIKGPILEELINRAIPSLWMDDRNLKKQHKQDPFDPHYNKHQPIKNTLLGHELTRPTMQEVGWGLVTSTCFAYGHSFTVAKLPNGETRFGYNSQTLPTALFASGMAFWGLQRYFGVAANTTAHIAFNMAAVRKMKDFK